MTTSGTTAWSPSSGSLVMQAFRRIGITRSQLTAEMLADAREELNYLSSSLSTLGPNLWAIDLQTATLSAGQSTLTLDPSTMSTLDVYMTLPSGQDILLSPMSRETYAAMPNKLQQGQPSTYWLDRLSTPVLYLWPVPVSAYTLSYYRNRRLQDYALSGSTPDVPFRALDALCWSLAERMAIIYAKDAAQMAGAKAQAATQALMADDTEAGPVSFGPQLGAYFL